jgi:hypothetical protein
MSKDHNIILDPTTEDLIRGRILQDTQVEGKLHFLKQQRLRKPGIFLS